MERQPIDQEYNGGLNLEKEFMEARPEDWFFGAFRAPDISIVPKEEIEKYLPLGLVQYGQEDFMDCATRDKLNALKVKFNYLYQNDLISPENKKWFEEKGYVIINKIEFSTKFNAILSGTTRQGNSLKAPAESIRKDGLIPYTMLPQRDDMTFEEYHNKEDITQEMIELGKEFLKRFPINYEKVMRQDFPTAMKTSILGTGGYAWYSDDGKTYGYTSRTPNHAFMIYLLRWKAWDNYRDWNNDFIKELRSDYNFMSYGYRMVINEVVPPKPEKEGPAEEPSTPQPVQQIRVSIFKLIIEKLDLWWVKLLQLLGL